MEIIQNTTQGFFGGLAMFLPRVLAGFLILVIGLLAGSVVRDIVKIFLKYFRLERWLKISGIASEEDVSVWTKIFSELARWMVIFLFLISAVEMWGLPKVGEVIGKFLEFLPNVFVAVVIGWIGLVSARFMDDIVRHLVKGVGYKEELLLGKIAKFAILFFTSLIILTQLGVAADLVKILFTGIIASISLAMGLAFGLGGQDEAREIFKSLRIKLSEKKKAISIRKTKAGKRK